MLLAIWNTRPSGCLGGVGVQLVVQLGLWHPDLVLVQLASYWGVVVVWHPPWALLVGILLRFVQLGLSHVTLYLAWSWLIDASWLFYHGTQHTWWAPSV